MKFGFVNEENMSLLTDLYELTMAQVYFEKGMNETAIFDFYTRPVPNRSFLVNAGLEQLIYYLLNIKFTDDDIEYLRSTEKFNEDFLNFLKNFKFTGNLYAVDEGEIIFPNEPVVQIEAPLIEAQIIETFLINTLQLPILVATKAVRCYLAAKGTFLIDFGLRRSQGTDAGMKAARSAYIGGFDGTSNVLAGKEYGIPIFGTMAHSYILAFGDEIEAFSSFSEVYPNDTIFLVDTFDTIKGVKNAVKAVKEKDIKFFKGVRLDSGDLLSLSKEVRKILNSNGFYKTKIFASGGINEFKIKELISKKAPIDGWGVGTELVVSADLPYLDCAYKLVEYNKNPVMKLSSKKLTLPYKKQIYRFYEDGTFKKDVITRYDEKLEKGIPLLKEYLVGGKLVRDLPSIKDIRNKTLENLNKLPDNFKDIERIVSYTPEVSKVILETVEKLKKRLIGKK